MVHRWLNHYLGRARWLRSLSVITRTALTDTSPQ
jgi:hypothetical protein